MGTSAAGPWKGLWLRRGYDPRSSAASTEERKRARGYQGIEIKMPAKRCALPAGIREQTFSKTFIRFESGSGG